MNSDQFHLRMMSVPELRSLIAQHERMLRSLRSVHGSTVGNIRNHYTDAMRHAINELMARQQSVKDRVHTLPADDERE